MPNEIELTRRKILASLGAVGAAGAGAGLGTSALFTDEESFTNNSIVAGQLDMKVDWEEHYSFPQYYGLGDPASGLDVTRTEPSDPSNYTAFPPGVEADDDGDPILWVNNEDVPAYHENTSIEAFPDTDTNGTANDGVQDDFDPANACSVLTDVSDGSGGLNDGARTENAATTLGDPLVDLDDVKPGDFGEVTLSFHLCNNPGYVWMNGALRSSSEGGLTEPESDSPDEQNGTVELLDEVQTALWYDENCDNLTDGATEGGGGDICAQLVLDSSGSMDDTDGDSTTRNEELIAGAKSVAASILNANPSNRVGVVDFDSSASVLLSVGDSGSQTLSTVENNIEQIDADGGTDIGLGIDTADEDLANCPEGAQRIQIVVTDANDTGSGDNADDAVGPNGNTDEIFAVGTGGASENGLREFARPADDNHTFLTEQGETLDDILDQLGGQITTAEEIFFQGSLREALNALSSGDGIPLDGDGGNDFDETSDPANADSRGCFMPTPETNCIGFSWWIPTEVGNHIQSDSVAFDLGFYTEQCRNNDGAGNVPAR